MKLKIVVVDFEIPKPVKKWGLRVGLPVLLLAGGGAIARAALPHAFADGEVLTAQDLNDNFTALDTRLSAVEGQAHAASGFRALLTTTPPPQIPNSTPTPILFDFVSYDLGKEYNAATGAFIPKSGGTYLLTCGVEFDPSATAANGVPWSIMLFDGQTILIRNDSYFQDPEAVMMVYLAAGDSVTCQAYQASGVTAPLSGTDPRNAFSAVRLF